MVNNLVLLVRFVDGKPSGVSRYIETLLQGLHDNSAFKSQFDITVLSFFTNVSDLVRSNLNCNEVKIPFFYGFETFRRSLSDVIEYFKNIEITISLLLKKYNHIIVHIQEMCFIYLAEILKSKYNASIVFHQHVIPWKFSYGYDECTFNRIYQDYINGNYTEIRANILESDVYKHADIIVTVSNMAKDYIQSVFNVSNKKIVVISNGINDLHGQSRTYFSNNLLFVGRLSKEKGFHFLIEALALLSKRGIYPMLIAIGEDLMSPNTKNIIQQHKLNIQFRGRLNLDEIVRIYKEGPIGIIPSIHEQCSYTAIEMAMFGLPVIYTAIDGLLEIFEKCADTAIPIDFDRHIGITISPDVLADKISHLINNEHKKHILSHQNRTQYITHFTANRMISETIKLYRRCL